MEQTNRPPIDRLDLRLLDILQRQGALSVAEVAAKTKLSTTTCWRRIQQLEQNGHLTQRRSRQALQWMNELITLGLEEAFRQNRAVAARLPALQAAVDRGQVTPLAASRELLALLNSKEA